MSILIITILLAIGISSLCSLMEAALYAVPLTHVKHLAGENSRPGKLLLKFKEDIGKPIAGVLILNTIANSGGAAVAVKSNQGIVSFGTDTGGSVTFPAH